ncbi:hypothetical protein TUM3794_19850 [Shewanella colwelliana]|uniref:Uncharacterized protein n=1 Tax=Shewanella colwelliana TaxID=23 RepID=A0ABQ4P0A1_SHECO|nr:hypothetical protein [Shewanella colwelliana]GIU40879.1 hypothetical protein TUM3794_19850 [Shewanella colwelliana]
MQIVLDNLLLGTIIKAISSIFAAALPSFTAFYLGNRLIKKQKLQRDLKVALNDIQYLLAVEQYHCHEHKLVSDQSKKQMIRDSVAIETSLTWSGKFTPSRIARYPADESLFEIMAKITGRKPQS